MVEPTYHITSAAATITVTHAAALESQPDAAFELAKAPDGLPLVMHVERTLDVHGPVTHAMRGDALPSAIEYALDELARLVRAHGVTRRLIRVGARLYYETLASVSQHLGTTLLARMLGAVSPMVLPQDAAAARSSGSPSRFENSALVSISDVARARSVAAAPPITFGRDARLWIGVTRGTPSLAAGARGADPAVRLESARPLTFESLLGIRSASWHVVRHGREPTIESGKLADEAGYRAALATAHRLAWSISRVDATRLVAELARSVDAEWHSRGRVHGDLKPGNVLLDAAGIHAFDALDVPQGECAAGMTEGWAAPEQILARPLAAATDVFALGLLAAAAIGAVIFGEEQTVVVPAVGDGRRRLRMLKDPEVWLDPTTTGLDVEARIAWRDLIMTCLAFAPARRPPRGAELARRIDERLDRWDVPGRVRVDCGPGRLEYFLGRREGLWILSDRG